VCGRIRSLFFGHGRRTVPRNSFFGVSLIWRSQIQRLDMVIVAAPCFVLRRLLVPAAAAATTDDEHVRLAHAAMVCVHGIVVCVGRGIRSSAGGDGGTGMGSCGLLLAIQSRVKV
jgi:hypothetical protein